MLENKFARAGVFFVVAFSIPLVLGIATNDYDSGLQVGVVMGIIFAVTSQYFEPKPSVTE